MPDLENVIRGLECCSTSERYSRKDCMKCPYNMPDGIACCSLRQLRLDAISLLKAQKSEYERGKRDGVSQFCGSVKKMKNMSIDREKATKGLSLCRNHLEIGSGFCDKCPYFHEKGCRFHMAEDVYKLLKMQEPRLLTLTELLNAKNIDIYLEETCEIQTHPLLLVETENESRNQAAFFWPSVVRPLKSYGKTWRCWTSRPTDEQREAVKWNANE